MSKSEAERDAVAIFRSYARGDATAIADVLEQQKTDEEAAALISNLTGTTCVMAELLAGEKNTDPRDEVRREIQSFGDVGQMGSRILDYVGEVLTADKGATIALPQGMNPDEEALFQEGSLRSIIEIGVNLARGFTETLGISFDATMEKLQLLMAGETD